MRNPLASGAPYLCGSVGVQRKNAGLHVLSPKSLNFFDASQLARPQGIPRLMGPDAGHTMRIYETNSSE
jgi:hypothetical protein